MSADHDDESPVPADATSPTELAPSELHTEPDGRSGASATRTSPSTGATLLESPFPEIPGYRILRRLGTGGMGEVFEAHQFEPVRRRVAIKIIRSGRSGPEVVGRFEAERQALALMDHSSIAKAYDAGLTEDGRPWLAMELVRGLPIHRYCDERRLGIRERIELFLGVCAAVQHAHQKGIIHRDLKPSNVLIKTEDDRPMAKVIDFGIAKAISMPLTENALETTLGQAIGTPEFMSPEQAGRGEIDVDTRTDVFALGAILYLLLTGRLPFDSKELRSAGPDEMRRRIREDEPPRPSVRVDPTEERTRDDAARRGLEPDRLRRRLSGDLDWIVVRAMEKDRTERYESVGALADDLRAHLEDRPIRAGKPTVGIRLRKFVRRHRLGTAVAATITLLVLASATALGLLAARLAEERDRANLEARTAAEVADFLVELFEDAGPGRASDRTPTVREVLDRGARRLEGGLSGQPRVRARVMDAVGRVYLGLGVPDAAKPLLEEALELRREALGETHPETADSLEGLARLRAAEGRRSEQEELARRALALRESSLGSEHPDVAESLRSLGWALMHQDRYDEARPLLERALAIRERSSDVDEAAVAQSLFDLGMLHLYLGHHERAEELLRRMIAKTESSLGPDHHRLVQGLDALGALLWTRKRPDEAEPLFARSLEILEKTTDPDGQRVADALGNLGLLAAERGRTDEAIRRLERALALHERNGGRRRPETATAMANLAWVLHRAGDTGRAEELYREALEIQESALGPDHSRIGTLLTDYGRLLSDLGRNERAREMLRRGLEIRRGAFGDDHLRVAESLQALAEHDRSTGGTAAARDSYRRALDIRLHHLGANHPAVVELREALRELE